MFILTTFEDLVQIPPHGLVNNKITRQDLEDRINEKYSNKVVQKVGLCICMYDLVKASDGLIGHGTGNVNVNVQFRMIVFRPFKNEIVTGRITKCTAEGIRISVRFFDDIFVPSTMLFDGCYYDADEQTWIWHTEPENEDEEANDLFLDVGDTVNFRIESESWHDQAPAAPKVRRPGEPAPESETEYKPPYSIEVWCSISRADV
ncbi:DNA-directed RNA polymerase III subunit RPC8 [Cladophialophora yegresii CBS 114405]|uniref:DNA-directed RNA polymerase subunit n=1 Tax=Cladophialophora yegresii CBS 114405 TaxID=1182544 RepID=W9WE39_9EURO|nr:DNA-directed RNA polymerase III subunit RPC8 [Cladophialophora yegresii CBS 114405]EXJ56799.1 DNA-directed RNA polymerase III subunit RPC8 [Cladophialophora yegresii CBS 114405]